FAAKVGTPPATEGAPEAASENPAGVAARAVAQKLAPELARMEREDRWGGVPLWNHVAPLLRVTMPAPWGEGAPFGDYAAQIEEFSRASGTLAMSFHLNRLMAEMILNSGSDEQKNRCLPG